LKLPAVIEVTFPRGASQPFGDVFASETVRCDFGETLSNAPMVSVAVSGDIRPMFGHADKTGVDVRVFSHQPVAKPISIKVSVSPFAVRN
jgi:hypothetical protein